MNRKSVDRSTQLVLEYAVDHPMAGNPPSVDKLFGHNDDFKVRLRTVWYIVIVAFVDNLEMQRLE